MSNISASAFYPGALRNRNSPYPLFLFGSIDIQVAVGTLSFSDNFLRLVYPHCKVSDVRVEMPPDFDGVFPATFAYFILPVQLAPTGLNLVQCLLNRLSLLGSAIFSGAVTSVEHGVDLWSEIVDGLANFLNGKQIALSSTVMRVELVFAMECQNVPCNGEHEF